MRPVSANLPTRPNTSMEQFQNLRTMLEIAVQVHNWESEHFPELETMSGRFIFLSLVTYFYKDQQKNTDKLPLKSIYRTDNISEKSIRNKLKDFKAQGLIQFVSLEKDGRGKCAVPTKQLIKRLIEYAEQINYIIRNHYYLVAVQERNDEWQNTDMPNRQKALLMQNLKTHLKKDLSSRVIKSKLGRSRSEEKEMMAFEI
jgi:hypothetical protein